MKGQSMQQRRFAKNNSSFQCGHCGKTVPAAAQTSRNHCPFCLYSRHLDINPGDRASDCGGLMQPTGYAPHPKKGLILSFRCLVCGHEGNNKAILEDARCPDDYDAILALTPRLP